MHNQYYFFIINLLFIVFFYKYNLAIARRLNLLDVPDFKRKIHRKKNSVNWWNFLLIFCCV